MQIYVKLEGSPGRVLGVIRTLAAAPKKRSPSDDLRAMLQPPALRETLIREQLIKRAKQPADLAKQALDVARATGFLDGDAKGKDVCFAPHLTPKHTDPETLSATLPITLVGFLCADPPDAINDLATVLAWLMTQPIAATPETTAKLKLKFKKVWPDFEGLSMKADTQWEQLLYWARYLGLIWQRRFKQGAGVVVDPTCLLRRFLDELLAPGEKIEIKKFVAGLGERCPVLDGGVVRKRVLATLGKDLPQDVLSDALSFALERLKREQVLDLIPVSDTKETRMHFAGGDPIDYVERLV